MLEEFTSFRGTTGGHSPCQALVEAIKKMSSHLAFSQLEGQYQDPLQNSYGSGPCQGREDHGRGAQLYEFMFHLSSSTVGGEISIVSFQDGIHNQ